ncbi:hypothetical protein AURDEDRAFT_133643 [Auricularia subglabra TFB-10046 SS5]|nr:hypothetical protein AURDEDRAFT_133643 [Auricularia subglabra TFB-10046 SS5]
MSLTNYLPSFLGGAGLALSAHSLLALNGSVFGISGFVHRGARGAKEGIAGVLALVVGGMLIGKLKGTGPVLLESSFVSFLVSGLLVGVGTKMANGCTSGHMLCGLARFSKRSFAATLTFFTTGVLTTRLLHAGLSASASPGPGITQDTRVLLFGVGIALLASWITGNTQTKQHARLDAPGSPTRLTVQVLTSLGFAFALHVSQLVDPLKVLGFLVLPFHAAFDPALLFLAVGAIPLLTYFYHTGERKLATSGDVDARLSLGAAIFGVGWAIEGICPGPALVNFGQSLAAGGAGATQIGLWLAGMVGGGLLVPS